MITLSEAWRKFRPPVCVGILAVSNAPNSSNSPALLEASQQLEEELRQRFGTLDRSGLKALPVFAAYDSFYRQFRKTYHVQLQLESIIFKGKSIRYPSGLVGAMFMSELKTGLLTAAHDLEVVDSPLTADIALGQESYLRLDGSEQELKSGDLYIRDQGGILSSVIYGPDQRTQITPSTEQAVFTTYGPPGISKEQVLAGLHVLEEYIRLVAPGVQREELLVA